MHMGALKDEIAWTVALGQGFFFDEGEAFVLQCGQKAFSGDAVKFAAIAACAKPAAFACAQIQIAGKLGAVAAIVDGAGPAFLGGGAHEFQRERVAPGG